jgi:hypothetical protein
LDTYALDGPEQEAQNAFPQSLVAAEFDHVRKGRPSRAGKQSGNRRDAARLVTHEAGLWPDALIVYNYW